MISSRPEHLFESPTPSPPRNRTSDARETYDDRLNHILRSATDTMARVGYEKASMRAVAKAAGVSLAGLYHYFDGKEKILFLIQFRTFTSLLNNFREKLYGVDDPLEQFRVLVRNHVDYFAANMAALKTCSHELDSLSGDAYKQTRRVRREYYDLARSVVDRVLDDNAPHNHLDRHVVIMSLFGTLNWLYRWYNPKKDRSPAALAEQIADQFLHGVLGAKPAPAQNSAAAPTRKT